MLKQKRGATPASYNAKGNTHIRSLLMKKMIVLAAIFAFASPCLAVDVSQIVFGITSSAKTSTANLRIIPMKQKMVNASGTSMQVFTLDGTAFQSYFLTKSTTVTPLNTWGAIMIQTDQDTNLCINSDSTNCLKIYSGVPQVFGIK